MSSMRIPCENNGDADGDGDGDGGTTFIPSLRGSPCANIVVFKVTIPDAGTEATTWDAIRSERMAGLRMEMEMEIEMGMGMETGMGWGWGWRQGW